MKTFSRALLRLSLLVLLSASLPLQTLAAGTGSIDAGGLATTDATPALSGTASGAKSVRVLVENGKGKDIYKSSTLKIKEGKWKANVGKKLPVGNYTVTLYGPKGVRKDTLSTATLSILPAGSAPASGETVSVSPILLLTGGNAAHGTSVPVAYVKVSNTGTASTSISGFTLTENGSAPDDVVIGFATNDDTGGSRATIGGLESTTQFKKGFAYVPLVATIGPKQFRIFTIKAILSQYSGSYFGKQLMIDVVSIDTKAAAAGTFPIRGTTWTLVY